MHVDELRLHESISSIPGPCALAMSAIVTITGKYNAAVIAIFIFSCLKCSNT